MLELLAPLLLVSLLACGCGRVGLELLPRDAGEDAAGETDAGSDAGEDMDGAALDAASDADTLPKVDGCVVSEAGICRSCLPLDFKSEQACGVGYCRAFSQCNGEAGVELACVPGDPHAPTDTTCDGVDDNCNGVADEDYVGSSSSCGSGLCARMGAANTCVAGSVHEDCVPGAPTSAIDDATGSGNGLDDDCDGRIDEDVSPCDTTPRTFEAGVHNSIPVPMGCTSATVQLWGGAGSAGSQAGISDIAPGGRGGSGGYALSTLMLSGPLSLFVGKGGGDHPLICVTAGTNLGAAIYNGGRGGGGDGAPGAPDGMVAGGGSGASNFFGSTGGRGNFGGGGGGESAGDPVNGIPFRGGGGGGAASVAMLNNVRVMVAGGGGGGGGAASLVYSFGQQGGNGGEGCSGSGTAGAGPRTGGGGGGGVCVGMTTSAGTSGRPANANLVPAPRARGSNADCAAGGDGYAIVTFAR